MFHTEYFSDLSPAIIYILERQNIIDKIFVLYNISEDDGDKEWDKEYADLFYNLVWKSETNSYFITLKTIHITKIKTKLSKTIPFLSIYRISV